VCGVSNIVENIIYLTGNSFGMLIFLNGIFYNEFGGFCWFGYICPMNQDNQKIEDFERDYVYSREHDTNEEMAQGSYFIEVVNLLPHNIFPDHYIQRNSPLLTSLSNEFYLMNEQSRDMPSHRAAKSIEVMFRSILIHGLR